MEYTKESLQNTWGVVESEEHAEFIIELCRNANTITSDTWKEGNKFFSINYNGLLFWGGSSFAKARSAKQITIQLPPKADNQELIEWPPKIGDDVVIADQHNKLEGKLLALTKEYAIISQPHGEQHLHLSSWSFEKPKSAEDLKIEELHAKLCEFNTVDNYILACDIVMGNIEGLSYDS